MNDKRFTDEQRAEIRAAAIDEYRSLIVGAGGAERFADGMMSRLTPRPKIGPDVVVTYDGEISSELVGRAGDLGSNDTNIMPHYPEVKVLEWAEEIFKQVWSGNLSWVQAVAEFRAKMDAHKRGEG